MTKGEYYGTSKVPKGDVYDPGVQVRKAVSGSTSATTEDVVDNVLGGKHKEKKEYKNKYLHLKY